MNKSETDALASLLSIISLKPVLAEAGDYEIGMILAEMAKTKPPHSGEYAILMSAANRLRGLTIREYKHGLGDIVTCYQTDHPSDGNLCKVMGIAYKKEDRDWGDYYQLYDITRSDKFWIESEHVHWTATRRSYPTVKWQANQDERVQVASDTDFIYHGRVTGMALVLQFDEVPQHMLRIEHKSGHVYDWLPESDLIQKPYYEVSNG